MRLIDLDKIKLPNISEFKDHWEWHKALVDLLEQLRNAKEEECKK